MNEVQEFILRKVMQKVASKSMQKEAGEGNWFKDKYEQATDRMAENLFLSDIDKLRRRRLKPNEPATLSSELVQGDSTWFSFGPTLSNEIRWRALKPYEDKSEEAHKKFYSLIGNDSLWAKAQKAYYRKLRKYYEGKQDKESERLYELFEANEHTPYIEFRKQHPELFK